MMHSSTRNNGPLDLTTINCSSRRRLSLTISMEDGSCHDLTNLSLKANMPQKDLFPSAQVVRRLPDIDDSHTLQLWTPLPRSNLPLHRSNTTTTCTLKADERVTPRRRSSQQRAPPRRPTTCADETSAPLAPPSRSQARCDSLSSSSTHNTPSPRPPCMSQSDRAYSAPPPPRPTPPAPATIPSARPGEPGPRPKVNYKKLYGAGAGSGSKRDLRSSQRHISFQEQQLQRTLEEEERLRREKEEGTAQPSQQQEEEEQPEEPSPRPPASPRRRSPSPPSPRPPQHEEQPVPPLVSMMTNHKRNDEEKPRPAPAPYQHAPPRPRTPPSGSSQTVMEIAPNLFVPYKGSHETWEAVQRGQFTVTTCFACTLQLVVIDTAEFLVCPDCHTVSPLSYSGDQRVERCGVGLGIKREWCDTEAALPTDMQGQQQQSSAVFAPLAMQPYPTNANSSSRPSRSSYEQRHQEKQAKYNERSASPEHDDRATPAQRRATFLI